MGEIDINKYKKFDNIEKSYLVMYILETDKVMESKNTKINEQSNEITRLRTELKNMVEKLTSVKLPEIPKAEIIVEQKPQSPPQPQQQQMLGQAPQQRPPMPPQGQAPQQKPQAPQQPQQRPPMPPQGQGQIPRPPIPKIQPPTN